MGVYKVYLDNFFVTELVSMLPRVHNPPSLYYELLMLCTYQCHAPPQVICVCVMGGGYRRFDKAYYSTGTKKLVKPPLCPHLDRVVSIGDLIYPLK